MDVSTASGAGSDGHTVAVITSDTAGSTFSKSSKSHLRQCSEPDPQTEPPAATLQHRFVIVVY